MGTWDDVLKEVVAETPDPLSGQSGPDLVRRRKILKVESISGIPLVVYAVNFVDAAKAANIGAGLQIDLNDKTGFHQATSDIPPGPVDVLLHSPGGSPTATESLVHLLRAKYNPIRFIIPHTAKSAATMLAFSGNEVLFGRDAELGPIDLQMQISQDGRVVSVQAQAALDQFDHAYQELSADPKKVAVWLPIVRQFGPSFLQECRNAIALSEEFVTEWLKLYMFAGDPDAEDKAVRIATWLANHNNFKSHSRRIGIEQLLAVEPTIKVSALADREVGFEDAVMDVYWAYDITFNQTDAFKIIEHQHGSAYVRSAKLVPVLQQAQNPINPAPPANRPGGRGQARRDQFGRR